MICYADTEVFSEADLKKVGAYKYAEHPSTELLVLCYAFGDGPVNIWVPSAVPAALSHEVQKRVTTGNKHYGPEVPADLREWIEARKEVRFHNAGFDRTVLNNVAGKRLNFPAMAIEQTSCSSAQMRAHGLPGGLEEAAIALGTAQKSDFGKGVMYKLCRPRTGKVKRYGYDEAVDEYAQLYHYCANDVVAARAASQSVPELTESERRVWVLDQHINARGVGVDLAAVANVQVLIDEYKAYLEKLCLQWTGFQPTQRDKLAGWVRANGYPQLPDMTAETVNQAVKDPACPENVAKVLRLYSTFGMKAVSKYESMVRAVCADGRIRGMFLFYGAGPGRWSSQIVQLQNLYRPKIEDTDTAIDAFAGRDLDWIRDLYEMDPMKVFASCVRGMLVPASGKNIMAMDFTGIESRITAWVFDEHWKIKAFNEMDAGTGPDMYKLAYSRAFRVPVEAVSKQQRQIGKVCVAEGTLVLCRKGWTPIQDVQIDDELWDGNEWVKHQGLLNNGFRKTVNLCGSWLTPDHLVWCGQDWKRTDWLLERKDQSLIRALDTAAANLPSRDIYGASANTPFPLSSSGVRAVDRSILSPLAHCGYSSPQDASFAGTKKPTQPENLFGVMPSSCLTTNTAEDCWPGSQQPSLVATVKLQNNIMPTAEGASAYTSSGERISENFSNSSKQSRGGTTPPCKWTEYETTKATNQATSGFAPEKLTIRTAELSRTTRSDLRVYDLLSVGSKNRFTIWTDAGALLVHNCELSMGFEGGVGAFVTMVGNYGVDLVELTETVFPILPHDVLSDALKTWDWAVQNRRTLDLTQKVYVVCDALKRLWRLQHPAHVEGWATLKEAALQAVSSPGSVYGLSNKKILFCVKDRWLYMRLPSGRKIAYYKPHLDKEGGLRYWGVNTETRQWTVVSPYGGRFCQNFSEGIARDLLVNGLFKVEESGAPVIGSVHDEGLFEPSEDWGTLEKGLGLFTDRPNWSVGLPLNAEGFVSKRYRK